jgi:hypothetical protein
MAHMTIAQAAKHVGVDRSTISRAIKSGRLSIRVLDSGKKGIDPAELERAYPSNRPNAHARTHEMPKHAPHTHHAELVHELHARINAQSKEIEVYRDREKLLLELLAQQGRLLEHKPKTKKPKKKNKIDAPNTIDVESIWVNKKGKKKKKGKKN